MPLYEYKCDACGERFELIQKYSDLTETCIRCGKGPVHRLHSSPAIQFKGSGFYITDYTQKGDTDYAQKGKSGGESSSPGGEGKSDTTEKGEKSDAKKSDRPGGETSTRSESSAAPSPAPKPPTSTPKD